MACFHPLQAWQGPKNGNGKRPLVWKKPGISSAGLSVPCGQCIGCRLEKSRQWALRCVHEASLHTRNCFLTLTYDDCHYPSGGSLSLHDIQCFFKRLRKAHGKLRFFQVGEYGDKYERPHFHVLLFGFDFEDKVPWKKTKYGTLYRSASLEALWPYGFSTVGDLTPMSAAYVARYAIKKLTGDAAVAYGDKKPEFITMSRRPGIGAGWYDRWKSDVFPRDSVLDRGKLLKVPGFYSAKMEKERPDLYARIKAARVRKAGLIEKRERYLGTPVDSFRRADKEKVLQSLLNSKKRSYENAN